MALRNYSDLVAELKSRLVDEPCPENEPNFLEDDSMLLRYLKSRDGNVDLTEKMLCKSMEWRRTYKPLTIDCRWCHERPGMHTLRQVGFDEAGRPVLYSSFTQAATQRNTAEESVTHLVYVLENAVKTMAPGITQWVLIFDCSGMTTTACHPRLGYECAQVLANHYPERLGTAFCVLPGAAFQAAWRAIRAFLPSITAAKVKLIKSKAKMRGVFEPIFSPATTDWLIEEISLNRRKTITDGQKRFWQAPEDRGGVIVHDPRGAVDYVTGWLHDHPSGHRAHPNIVDLHEHCLQVNSCGQEREQNGNGKSGVAKDNEADSEDEYAPELDEGAASSFLSSLPDEYQIPKNAQVLM